MPSFLHLFFIAATMLPVSTIAADDPNSDSTAEIEWQRLTPSVLDQAREENRLVLVDLAAEWCTFCKKMDRTTWRDPAVLRNIEAHYIPVRIQDEDEPELAEQYRQYGRPAILVLNGDGEKIARKRGYLKPQLMDWMLQGIVQDAEIAKASQ